MTGRMKGVLLLAAASLMQGCADSNLTHSANDQVQAVYSSGGQAVGDVSQLSPGRSWQGSAQATKGILIGGAAGGVAGGMTSGIGWVPGALGGAIIGGALGAWIDANTTSADRLHNRGAKVMVLGDQIRVVLLSQDLFQDDSATLSVHAYKTLDGVAQLINHYVNRSVTVAAYTDPGDRGSASVAFTKAEADSVVRYLWRAGVNTRLLYAAGYGGAHPVARPGGSHPNDNNRVEITLEKLPV